MPGSHEVVYTSREKMDMARRRLSSLRALRLSTQEEGDLSREATVEEPEEPGSPESDWFQFSR